MNKIPEEDALEWGSLPSPLPSNSRDLIAALAETYPDSELDRLCRMALMHGGDPRLADRYAGLRELIECLQGLLEEEDEAAKANDPAAETADGRPRILRPR